MLLSWLPSSEYPTPPDLAAHVILAAHAEGDIEDRLVADLGCGGGVLGIGAAHLGAGYVLGIDIDPAALRQAAKNTDDADVPVDLLACDVLRLVTRGAGSPLLARDAPSAIAPLPKTFIESALPTLQEFNASLVLTEDERRECERVAAERFASTAATAPSAAMPAASRGDDAPPTSACAATPAADLAQTFEPAGPAGHATAAPMPVGSGMFDCVLTNPPFGTQRHSTGADMAFLRAALTLCTPEGAVYSLHKTSTRNFIQKRTAEWGASARVVAELQFEIPKMYKHHKYASLDVAVDLWKVTPDMADAAEAATSMPLAPKPAPVPPPPPRTHHHPQHQDRPGGRSGKGGGRKVGRGRR